MPHENLLHKLGYQPNEAVDTVDAPEWFLEYLRGNGVHAHAKLPTHWMHLFMTQHEQLHHFLEHAKLREVERGFWVSWPKDGRDIDAQQITRIVTSFGWVVAGECDIDDEWKALKFTRSEA
jgi:hypothetical protein